MAFRLYQIEIMYIVANWKVLKNMIWLVFCASFFGCLKSIWEKNIQILDIEEDGQTYHVLLSKTYESGKELVATKKGKIRVSGFKQFVVIIDKSKGKLPGCYFKHEKVQWS